MEHSKRSSIFKGPCTEWPRALLRSGGGGGLTGREGVGGEGEGVRGREGGGGYWEDRRVIRNSSQLQGYARYVLFCSCGRCEII
jgi:hypothetical protein